MTPWQELSASVCIKPKLRGPVVLALHTFAFRHDITAHSRLQLQRRKTQRINKLEFTDVMDEPWNEDSVRRLTAAAKGQTSSPTAYSRIFLSQSRNFSLILWNPKFHHRVHNSSTFITGAQPHQSLPFRLISWTSSYYPPTHALVYRMTSFLQALLPKPCMQFSSSLFVPHAPTTSPSLICSRREHLVWMTSTDYKTLRHIIPVSSLVGLTYRKPSAYVLPSLHVANATAVPTTRHTPVLYTFV